MFSVKFSIKHKSHHHHHHNKNNKMIHLLTINCNYHEFAGIVRTIAHCDYIFR